ncbi:purine-cytosine permease family protein [Zophobihabitans entericus]|uniref:Allantoin permease n=1 Tax=Zophobihabitans entericus TaxID=1635327 RepID=A0A6G9IAX3_9GAMM|nr:cytosine permease [Zophobihabitans entericus]QIQ20730.1 allantoin permease [Zophobihabitans entericus]
MSKQNDSWQVEQLGIDIVPETERSGKPLQLFWIWSAANIGIMGIVYGAIVVSFGLSFIQSVLATVIGIASFALVGLTSFAGKKGRTTTLTLSRTIFGIKGNIAPTFFSWFNLTGWEAVNIITGTMTLAALFQAMGFDITVTTTIISLILFAGLAIIVSLLGQATVIWLQSWCTRIFGTLTLIVVIYIAAITDWDRVLSLPGGNWLTGFLPAVTFVAAGTGIGWALAGADYSRYQSESSSNKRIFGAVVGGACIPLFLLLLTGVLISVQLPDLASSANPIALIGSVLPPWMAIPYLLAATGGVITIAVLSLYSASLNLLTIGVKVKQFVAVSIDAVLVLGVAIYVLFISGDFLDPFIAFLIFCGLFMASWDAIFIYDYFMYRKKLGYDPEAMFGDKNPPVRTLALFCWLLGAFAGLAVTNTGFIDGPFAVGIFKDSSLGLFVSFFVSLIAYAIIPKQSKI